ncbi:unnamed protein product, partial [Calicophoron daubneyi]
QYNVNQLSRKGMNEKKVQSWEKVNDRRIQNMNSTDEDRVREDDKDSAVTGVKSGKYDHSDSRLMAAEKRIQELENMLRSSNLRDRVRNTDDKIALDGSRHIHVMSDDQISPQCFEFDNQCLRTTDCKKDVNDSPCSASVAKRYGVCITSDGSRDRVSGAPLDSHTIRSANDTEFPDNGKRIQKSFLDLPEREI